MITGALAPKSTPRGRVYIIGSRNDSLNWLTDWTLWCIRTIRNKQIKICFCNEKTFRLKLVSQKLTSRLNNTEPKGQPQQLFRNNSLDTFQQQRHWRFGIMLLGILEHTLCLQLHFRFSQNATFFERKSQTSTFSSMDNLLCLVPRLSCCFLAVLPIVADGWVDGLWEKCQNIT